MQTATFGKRRGGGFRVGMWTATSVARESRTVRRGTETWAREREHERGWDVESNVRGNGGGKWTGTFREWGGGKWTGTFREQQRPW